ncbi:MAG TPA: hypothetical protein P5077_14100, partial [bacterium]|nr:hypothetical protein [bacterium]
MRNLVVACSFLVALIFSACSDSGWSGDATGGHPAILSSPGSLSGQPMGMDFLPWNEQGDVALSKPVLLKSAEDARTEEELLSHAVLEFAARNEMQVRTFVGPDGKLIDEIVISGRPPETFRMSGVPVPHEAAGVLSNIPAFDWVYGCSATSAAMMAGFYDRSGYPDMYTGPTNGGVMLLNNSTWGYGECPLSATHQGYDGRSERGHVDDYWVEYNSAAADPYIASGWTQHTYGECTGDYMGTNQSALSNNDGSTTFYNYPDGTRLYNYTGAEPARRDGCHGLRDFFESRGYVVQENFNQYIMGYNGNTKGFTIDEFKAEIDAGRPVLIHVTNHTMLGYGYDAGTSTIYIHDTWDHADHTMTWGGSYSGLTHYGVSVIKLLSSSCECTTVSSCCDGCHYLPESTECRGSAGECDVAENCDGNS